MLIEFANQTNRPRTGNVPRKVRGKCQLGTLRFLSFAFAPVAFVGQHTSIELQTFYSLLFEECQSCHLNVTPRQCDSLGVAAGQGADSGD